MTTFTKALSALAVAAAAMTLAPAHALTVTFGGQGATDGSGLTSKKINASNVVNPATGYFVETFDLATSPALFGLTPGITTAPEGSKIVIKQNQGCAINSYNSVGVTVTGGGFGVQKGSTPNLAAAPAGDTTCFGYGPLTTAVAPNLQAGIRIDYQGFINNLVAAGLAPAGTRISYLGLYYGSIDTYNDISFFNGNTLLSGAGVLNDGKITGAEILADQGGTSGNQVKPSSNVYVNFSFDENETFSAFEFRNNSTNRRAFEVDNIVVGLTYRNPQDVPEPASLALMGLGLVGLAVARRRKQAK